jgi:hypothetical protein
VRVAHHEGLRERPVDVPATTATRAVQRRAKAGEVPIPARGESRRGEDEEEDP